MIAANVPDPCSALSGNTLSNQFYDDEYYDYEAMMMEMYLPFADNTKLEKYTQDVYDPASGKWVTEDLGEMTQRQYYEYLLSNTRTAQEQQITKDLEQWRKDQLGWWGQFGHDVLATLSEFGEGLLSGLTGIIDFVAAVGTGGLLPYAMNGFEGNYLDAFVDYFGENGLTAAEKRTVRAALDEYERTHTHFRDIDAHRFAVRKLCKVFLDYFYFAARFTNDNAGTSREDRNNDSCSCSFNQNLADCCCIVLLLKEGTDYVVFFKEFGEFFFICIPSGVPIFDNADS